jgi:hypothetical protein
MSNIAQILRTVSEFFREIYERLPRPLQIILAWVGNQILGTKIVPPKSKTAKGVLQSNQPSNR